MDQAPSGLRSDVEILGHVGGGSNVRLAVEQGQQLACVTGLCSERDDLLFDPTPQFQYALERIPALAGRFAHGDEEEEQPICGANRRQGVKVGILVTFNIAR